MNSQGYPEIFSLFGLSRESHFNLFARFDPVGTVYVSCQNRRCKFAQP